MTATNDKDQQPQGINKRRLVAFLLALPLYFGLFMFLPGGTWAWVKGWLFIGVFLGTLAVVALYLWRVNPEVVVARTGFHEGTKRWDILLRFFLPTVYGIIPVAALDAGRFQWLPVPCSPGRRAVSMVAGPSVGLWYRLCPGPSWNGDRHLGGSSE